MIKSDRWIVQMCRERRLLEPYLPLQVRVDANQLPTISAGVTSYGYDLRLAADYCLKVFSAYGGAEEIDPKNFDERLLTSLPLQTGPNGDRYWRLPARAYALGLTIETFNMPRNVIAVCVGKSTYARSGLIVNTTPIEPGWRGRLVLELYNATSLPIRVYADEGIAQAMFFEADEHCDTSYADRSGKYQHQTEIRTARV